MSAPPILTAIRARDRSVLDLAPRLSDAELSQLIEALPDLDDPERELALDVVARCELPRQGEVLLEATTDLDPMVASSAATALATCAHPPPLAKMLAAIPLSSPEFVRGALYRACGRCRDTDALARTRETLRGETSSEAALAGLVALVRLGGFEERARLLKVVRATPADDALAMRGHLLDIADLRFAWGLLPWFDSEAPVVRLGFDSPTGTTMARMSDIAVWTAASLGVRIHPVPGPLRVYSPEVVASARAAVLALPAFT